MDLGINLYTHHYSAQCTDLNPGLYLRENDWIVGVYRNSACKPSFLLGKVVWKDGNFEVLAGAITGYPQRKLTPALIPSYKLGHLRISPLALTGIHFSYERSLK
jgi:hypothetical protein